MPIPASCRVGSLLLVLLTTPLVASSYVVNDLGDAPDAASGNDVCATAGAVCTLRAAIQEANAHAGPDRIAFAVAGTIAPGFLSPLPLITSEIDIDGTSAPGYAGAPVVVLKGSGIGLQFDAGSSGSQLAGLKIHGCVFSAVFIASSNVTVRRNHLGPVGGGTANETGVELAASSASCTIGGIADGEGNVISGNGYGILVGGSGHSIGDNFIGTDAAGSAALPNQRGVRLAPAAASVFIGGAPGAENVISGNIGDGIWISGNGNTLAGNLIGTNATGSAAVANGDDGVEIALASTTTIGTPAARNVISGNARHGVHLANDVPLSTDTTFVNNIIGLDAAGTTAIANGDDGIRDEGLRSVVGTALSGNVISGNGRYGIELLNPSGRTFVRNNIIGLDATGTIDRGNAFDGVTANNAAAGAVTIGGTGPAEGNLIAGNDAVGISLIHCPLCEVFGNTIGLNADRTTARGNHEGIYVLGSSPGVTIGAPGGGMNVISGNSSVGIHIGLATNVTITNNRIGTDGTGMIDIGNYAGIASFEGSGHDISANVISGNSTWGLSIDTPNTRIYGNIIGRNALNSGALPNDFGGIVVGAPNCTIGTPELGGNIIASNNGYGGIVVPSYAGLITIAANSIFGNNAGSFQAGLGIDLVAPHGFGPNPNDPQDPDTGANALQNFPVLSSAVTTSTASWIMGSLNSTPATAFALHFYSNAIADPTGYGEGETYLGTTNVTTDAAGNATFHWNGPAIVPGRFITSTATGPSGTSEFSLVNDAVAAPSIHFSSSAYAAGENGGSVTITVVREGDLSVASTVDYATTNDTASAPSDYASASGTLTFLPSQASRTFNVTIVADGVDAPTERFNVTLANATAASITAPASAVVTIDDASASLEDVPTLSTSALMALLTLLAAIAIARMRL
jgi:CSLREA domain-containing protein